MSTPYIHRFRVRYSDLDSNGHVANISYMKYSLDTRVGYLAANGVTAQSMLRDGYGPVIFREVVTYRKELFAYEEIEVHYWVKSLHPDGKRFESCTQIRRADGELSAQVDIEGGWMSLSERRLAEPPEQVRQLMADLLIEAGALNDAPS